MSNIVGDISGRLTIVELLGLVATKYGNKTMVKCLCDCGSIVIVSVYQFKTQHVKSCGCLAKEHKSEFFKTHIPFKHGGCNHPLYHVYLGMMTRCYKVGSAAYDDYGGRGITVCDEWKNDIHSFYKWVESSGYKIGLTLDRENNDGNYTPKNCRWVTAMVQANNRRSSVYVTLNGVAITMADACRELGLPYKIINQRTKRDGLSFHDAILIPINKPHGRRISLSKQLTQLKCK